MDNDKESHNQTDTRFMPVAAEEMGAGHQPERIAGADQPMSFGDHQNFVFFRAGAAELLGSHARSS